MNKPRIIASLFAASVAIGVSGCAAIAPADNTPVPETAIVLDGPATGFGPDATPMPDPIVMDGPATGFGPDMPEPEPIILDGPAVDAAP